MTIDCWIISFLLFSCLLSVYATSDGNSDSVYRACVEQCEQTGCIAERCFSHCKSSSDHGSSVDGPCLQEAFYLQLKQWHCQSDCQYHCMADREKERAELGLGPAKYDGKWHFKRLYCFQEPVSVAFSAMNFVMHYRGWRNFMSHVYSELPQRRDKTTFYDYTGLWTIYALLSMYSCILGAIYHSRDMYLTKMLFCCSGVTLLGYSLILALIRSFSLRDAAARVMVAAPLLAFTITHILYLNNYAVDYAEWNEKVCSVMAIMNLLVWSLWAGITRHPSRTKLWMAVAAGGLGLLLKTKLDFPPYEGLADTHTLWHALTIPLTCIWWSFIKDDADYRTSIMLRKVK